MNTNRNTNRKIFVLFVVFSVGLFGSIPELYAANQTAKSCSYTDVSTAVTAASLGDTVTVPAGSCTWSSTLNINKGITLIGAGIGNTTITNGTSGGYIISYSPSDIASNSGFRISGFTFDLANGSGKSGINFPAATTNTAQTKVRIDNNRFQNIYVGSTQVMYIHVSGLVYGVVDNNYFTTATYALRMNGNTGTNNGGWWNNIEAIKFGQADNDLLFEDNTFNVQAGAGVIDCVESYRYAFRYNTIIASGPQPLFDSHGNWGNQYGCFGGELYGNSIQGGGRILDQRGGRFFVFNNSSTGSGSYIQVRDEANGTELPIGPYKGIGNPPCPADNGTCQDINGSYYWGNRQSLTGTLWSYSIGPNCVGSDCSHNTTGMPYAGKNFFTPTTSPALTCGTLANRPASCTAGQGYWATNQSCTDLTGMVGVHPSTPISGTLYRCGTSNTWDSGYTPLPYPHPLRGGVSGLLAPFLHAPVAQ